MDATRRGEPRRRQRGSRTLLAGCGSTAAVLTGVFIGYLVWANSLPPPERDTRPIPNPNGYDAVTKAATRLLALSKRTETMNDGGPEAPWSTDLQVLQAELRTVNTPLQQLRGALKLPYVTPRLQLSSGFRPHATYRNASRLFAGEARLALLDGKPGVAVDRALDAIELGAKVGLGAPYLYNLVGIECQGMGVAAAESVLPGLTGTEAKRAGQRLDRIIAGLPHPADVMDQERQYSLAGLREIYSGRLPLATSTASRGGASSGLDRALILVYPKAWSYRKVDDHYRTQSQELRKAYGNRTEPPSRWSPDPVVGSNRISVMSTSQRFTTNEATLRLLRARLALQEYRVRHGEWPATLGDLVPGTIPQVPIDPFTGRPLVYRPRGTDVLLYSVGQDLKDDGGTAIAVGGPGSTGRTDLLYGSTWAWRGAGKGR